jgi:hypothetical protein
MCYIKLTSTVLVRWAPATVGTHAAIPLAVLNNILSIDLPRPRPLGSLALPPLPLWSTYLTLSKLHRSPPSLLTALDNLVLNAHQFTMVVPAFQLTG